MILDAPGCSLWVFKTKQNVILADSYELVRLLHLSRAFPLVSMSSSIRQRLPRVMWWRAFSSKWQVTARLARGGSSCLYSRTPFDPRYLRTKFTKWNKFEMIPHHFYVLSHGVHAVSPTARDRLWHSHAFANSWNKKREIEVTRIDSGPCRRCLGVIRDTLEWL